MAEQPYHQHELEIQDEVGERAAASRNAAVIGESIPLAAMPFLSRQRFVVLASIDRDGSPWASMVFGEQGFLSSSPDGSALHVELAKAAAQGPDPLWANLSIGARIGGLAIELMSRRRLRMNGVIAAIDARSMVVRIEHAYPNCPKYIQRRHLGGLTLRSDASGDAVESNSLESQHHDLIGRSDTLFVATVNPSSGLDASHRGGEPGFVEIVDDGSLRIPDYPGNSMFNTLGNIRSYPRAGLLFPDFQRGAMLQVTGVARLDLFAEDQSGRTGGTGRFWSVMPKRVRLWHTGLGAAWELIDSSPFNPRSAPAGSQQETPTTAPHGSTPTAK